MERTITLILVTLVSVVKPDSNITAQHRIYSAKFKSYNKNVLPPQSSDGPVNVNFTMHLVSVNDFDERSGTLTLLAMISIQWLDLSFVWPTADFDNISHITVPQEDVWLPELFNLKVSDKFVPLGNSDVFKVKIKHDGHMLWTPGDLMMVKCAPDVTKFPFDTQNCGIHLSAWGYTAKEITFTPLKSSVEMTYYEKSGEWEIVESSIRIEDTENDFPIAIVNLTLKRMPLFYFVNNVFPVILIAMLNPLVFILPCESGERTSYSLTILLSFTVFMMVVSSALPPTSEPMSALSYFVGGTFALSGVIATINIFQLRMYYRDNVIPVPKHLVFFTKKRFAKNKTHPQKISTKSEVTWQDVVHEFDIIHLILCYILTVCLILGVFITVSG